MYSQPPQLAPHQHKSPIHHRVFNWYRRQRPFAKFAVIFIIIVMVFSSCVCSLVAAATSSTTNQSQTQTTLANSIMQILSKAKPTTMPTHTFVLPIAKPTAKPTSKPIPTQVPTPKSTPTPPCQGVNGNPWCYNFTPGNYINSLPSSFCSYFSCIGNFWNGHGYVNECSDGHTRNHAETAAVVAITEES